VNLLPVQKKKSRDPGDNREMVEARRRFLDAGHYDPIADAVVTQVSGLSTGPSRTILDSGCGEGFYLHRLALALAALDLPATLLGLDISKHAIQLAAKKNRDLGWLVASARGAPIQPHSLDTILCLFGFCFYEDFARLLKPGGSLLRVDAGPEHLLELRQRIYPELKPARPFNYLSATDAGFALQQEHALRFTLPRLDDATLHQLMAMTPHMYRADKSLLGRLTASEIPPIRVDVVLRRFELTIRQRYRHAPNQAGGPNRAGPG
jgi:23S rRNA (guanine745-N1)-methyltransferase